MASRLLLDIGPTGGGHGMRGIGSYVRGLIGAIGEWPVDRQERIWALGLPGEELGQFGARGIAARSLTWRPADAGWLFGRLASGRAVRRAKACALHATDPNRPWLPGGLHRVITVYDLIPLRETTMLGSWRPDHRLLYGHYLRQVASADAVIAISHATAADLIRLLHVPQDRISVVYPVVRQGVPVVRTPSVEPTFLYVGALELHKQPQLAVQALATFRTMQGEGRLRFIGPSRADQRAGLLQEAERLGVRGFVEFEGRIPDEALDEAYASATALLTTSRVEGFGLPAVEAVLRRVPVIAVETEASRETLGRTAILTPADPNALAAAMASPHLPTIAAVNDTRARFSSHTAGESLWAVYERLLS